MKIKYRILASIAWLLTNAAYAQTTQFSSGFENGTTGFHSNCCTSDGAVTTNEAKSGIYSFEAHTDTLQPADPVDRRDEIIVTGNNGRFFTGEDYCITFSVKANTNSWQGNLPVWMTLFQTHTEPAAWVDSNGNPCVSGDNSFSITASGGKLGVNANTIHETGIPPSNSALETQVYTETGDFMNGQWRDVAIRFRPAKDNTGLIRVEFDGTQVFEQANYPNIDLLDTCGGNTKNYVYAKTGIYREYANVGYQQVFIDDVNIVKDPLTCSSSGGGGNPLPPPAPTNALGLPYTATASSDDGNVAANVGDQDLNTRWSANGQGEYITMDLGNPYDISHVAIAFHQGDSRESYFDVQVSLDGVQYTTVLTGQSSSGTTLLVENYGLNNVLAQFVRVVGQGNENNNWNSITEIEVHPVTEEIQPSEFTLTASHASGELYKLTNGSLADYWTSDVNGASFTIDVGTVQMISHIDLAFWKGDERTAYFDLEYSIDGSNYSSIETGLESSGTSNGLQTFPIFTEARYIRYVGHGNSQSAWNSVTEMDIHRATGQLPIPIPTLTLNEGLPVSITASGSYQTSTPDKVLDGDYNTYWTVEGVGEHIDLDFGYVHEMDRVEIAFHKGDERTATFTVQASEDGYNYTDVITSQQSSGNTNALQAFSLTGVDARFLRIISLGNSQNDWSSMTEIRAYAETTSAAPSASQLSASVTESGYTTDSAVDNNYTTYWTAWGDGPYLQVDLGELKTVAAMHIAFFKGDERVAQFHLETSVDGVNYTRTTTSDLYGSGTTEALQEYSVQRQARFIRIVGHGNNQNDWNSILEIEVETANQP